MSRNQRSNDWIWWKHGVVYHIYPRSFFDSNGDGIGDLKGIVKKLGYLRKLGVDAIWLSPIYKSPQVDFGYDVSDFRKIDPAYGSLKILKILIHEAHKMNIRVIMDLIMNHTSDQHPWFKKAMSSPDHPKRKWYLWKKGKNGKKPNNWKTSFGGSAWTYHAETDAFYYHSFFKEQPDLNWRNKSLKKEYFSIVESWLKMGIDGFRLDVANFIVKDKKLRNNPGLWRLLIRKEKVYTRNRPLSLSILKELRELVDKYENTMLIGEIFTMPPGDPELAGKYLGEENNILHMAFDFSLIFTRWNAPHYAKAISDWLDALPVKGWPCHVLSNHDLKRAYNRPLWKQHKHEKSILSAFLLLTLKGTPFIYYGEEIGMRNVSLKYKYIQDPLGKYFWPFYSGRDKARTPMQWNSSRNAGFTKGEPWLPVHKNFIEDNVEVQLRTPGSLLGYYKKLIALRNKNKALYAGEFVFLHVDPQCICYSRLYKSDKIVVVLNFKNRKTSFKWAFKLATVLLSTHKNKGELILTEKFVLMPFEASILKVLN